MISKNNVKEHQNAGDPGYKILISVFHYDMKIVHSFWSKPFYERPSTSEKRKFLLTSFAFSCLQARKFYDNVELVTDKKGKDLLMEELGLPYTQCRTILDDVNEYETDIFSVGKIYAYANQTEPFLHIDGDLFIWEKFNDTVEHSPLTVLHPEGYPLYSGGYIPIVEDIKLKFKYVPECLQNLPSAKDIIAVNAAIMGGTDTSFYRRFGEEVFRFIDSNPERKLMDPPWSFPVVFEQLLYYYLVEDKSDINFYLAESAKLYSFSDTPDKNKVVHARSDQRTFAVLRALYNNMQLNYPEYNYRILNLAKTMSM